VPYFENLEIPGCRYSKLPAEDEDRRGREEVQGTAIDTVLGT
jgi:hypothetical protein